MGWVPPADAARLHVGCEGPQDRRWVEAVYFVRAARGGVRRHGDYGGGRREAGGAVLFRRDAEALLEIGIDRRTSPGGAVCTMWNIL